MPGDAHVQTGNVALLVEAGSKLALSDRVVEAVLHVLFTRPHELDRRPRHLLRDGPGLLDVVGMRRRPKPPPSRL